MTNAVCGKLANLGGEKLFPEDMEFLANLAADVVAASRVRHGEKVGKYGPNTSGATLIRPGGRACYPAFWPRDHAFSLESGLISLEEQKHAMLVTAQAQQEGGRKLPSGSYVPHGAIVDHVTLDGRPIYYPGTIDGDLQQGGVWGIHPPYCDHFTFTNMACHYVRAVDDDAILLTNINGRTLMERLELAFVVAPYHPDSHIVWCDESNRGSADGCTDIVIHTGDLLSPSVLKYRAAKELSYLHNRLGQSAQADKYDDIAACLKQAIPAIFHDGKGLMFASTGKSAQRDVWASCRAVYFDAVDEVTTRQLCAMFADAYKSGTLAYRGSVRHVLTCDDYSETSAWEEVLLGAPKNHYQNGGYWCALTGWICYAIAQVDPVAAAKLAREFIEELREGDYRKGEPNGSPWECFHPDGDHRQNPVYMSSVTAPLGAFRRMGW